jgi:hypothetical protein
MLRIIVKALRKRNETALARIIHEGFYCKPQMSDSSETGETSGKNAGLRSFLPIDLYKNTRRERLNLYGRAGTPDTWPTWTSINVATATQENTATARHPTASRLRRRHLARGPQRAAFRNILAQKVHMIVQFS